jgi:CheY-like chemotaxis protein
LQRLRFDQRILLLALAAGLPAALVSLLLLWTGDYTAKVQWTLTVAIVGIWLGCSFAVRHRVVLPLQTVSNLLAALREREWDLLVTDRSMPEMSGDQVAIAAKHVRPALPVILLTGFGDLMNASGELPEGVDCVLGKPLTTARLREALTTVISPAERVPA